VPEPFAARLAAAVAARGPLCAGIDPSPRLLAAWGLPDSAVGAGALASGALEALAGSVAAVKLNAAFFEQYGSAGLGALEAALGQAAGAGLLTVADVKRADIASTAAAYARAWLGRGSSLASDAVTVVPYLGLGALDPFVEEAEANGRGVLVVVRSSNPEGAQVQRALADGRPLESVLLGELAGRSPALGAVVGLAPGRQPLSLVDGPAYLAPGIGVQGATWAEFGAQFGSLQASPVVANLSRALLDAGPDPAALQAAAAAAAQAARAVCAQLGS
jgi:orotidine-5'-phosphate decarboxylase